MASPDPKLANRILLGLLIGAVAGVLTLGLGPNRTTVLELSRILINGGRRGFLVAIDPRVLVAELGAVPVSVALER